MVLLAFIPLFRVVHPKRKKPNLPWSLLCLVMFAMGLNVAYALLAEGTYKAIDSVSGLDIEVDLEKTRKPTRNSIAYPINVNLWARPCSRRIRWSRSPGSIRNGP